MSSSEDQRRGSKSHAAPRHGDTLGYLCDIIRELKDLADSAGQRTLSAILAAALVEARIQNNKSDNP